MMNVLSYIYIKEEIFSRGYGYTKISHRDCINLGMDFSSYLLYIIRESSTKRSGLHKISHGYCLDLGMKFFDMYLYYRGKFNLRAWL